MSATDGDRRKAVRCKCGPLCAEGRFDVSGPFLIVATPYGTVKTVLGLQDPRRLASRILKDRCQKQVEAEAAIAQH